MCVFSNIPWDWPGNLGTYHKAFQKKNNNNLSRNATDSLCGWRMLRAVCSEKLIFLIEAIPSIYIVPSKRSSIW